MALLSVKDLAIEFSGFSRRTRVVNGVSFDLNEGEILGLVGESGSGKSVTCRAIPGLLPKDRATVVGGSITFDGSDLVEASEKELRAVRGAAISMIFQNPSSHLDPIMTIGKQIAEPLIEHENLSKGDAKTRAIELLEKVGIPNPKQQFDAYPHEFSGGMRQRAMIAAALSCRPKLLIADEPTTALDVTVQAQIMRLLLDLRDRENLAIILVTHDLGVVAQTADSVAVMYAGEIVERAPRTAFLKQPLHPYGCGLVRSQPELATLDEPLPSIKGQPPSIASPPSGCRFHPRCEFAVKACASGTYRLNKISEAHFSACARWEKLVAQSPVIT